MPKSINIGRGQEKRGAFPHYSNTAMQDEIALGAGEEDGKKMKRHSDLYGWSLKLETTQGNKKLLPRLLVTLGFFRELWVFSPLEL